MTSFNLRPTEPTGVLKKGKEVSCGYLRSCFYWNEGWQTAGIHILHVEFNVQSLSCHQVRFRFYTPNPECVCENVWQRLQLWKAHEKLYSRVLPWNIWKKYKTGKNVSKITAKLSFSNMTKKCNNTLLYAWPLAQLQTKQKSEATLLRTDTFPITFWFQLLWKGCQFLLESSLTSYYNTRLHMARCWITSVSF